MRQMRTYLLLATTLAVLVGIAYWDEWQTKQDEEKKKTENKLTTIDPDKVTSGIYVFNSPESPLSISFEKNDNGWVLTSPINSKADSFAIENLVKTIADYKYQQLVSKNKDDWKNYGLDPFVRQITLKQDDGKVTDVYVGSKAPVGFSVYVRNGESDDVYIGGQHLYTATEKKLSDFRDKTLLSVDVGNLASFSLDLAKAPLVTVEKVESSFRLTKPMKADADKDAISDFFDSMASERVVEFIDTPDKKTQSYFSKSKRLATLSWSLSTGQVETLYFSEFDGSLWAAYDPSKVVFKLPDTMKEKIRKQAGFFQDKTLVRFKADDVTEVEVDGDTYQKVEKEWYVKSDASKASDKENTPEPQTFVKDLLVDLEFAKAGEILSSKNVPLKAAPKHRIKILFKEDLSKDPVVINVWPGKTDEKSLYVKVSGDDRVFDVEASNFANISPIKDKGQF